MMKDQIAMPPETNGLHKIKVYRSNGPVPTPKFSFDVDVPHFAEGNTVATVIASKAQEIVKQAATQAQEQVSSQAQQIISDATRQRAQLLQPFMQHSLPPPQLTLHSVPEVLEVASAEPTQEAVTLNVQPGEQEVEPKD